MFDDHDELYATEILLSSEIRSFRVITYSQLPLLAC